MNRMEGMLSEQYCLYLRKSRADAEAEERGEGETLARHEKMLLELAKKSNLNVTQIYREIVSGETIAARPVMQHLLQDVENGKWTGVLVVEVERLARGDTIDQGLVVQTFKYSNTKIITPLKVYNPNNEFDEEYFEFGLFMSRREYKTINRRLQRGRVESVKEGKYIASTPPYGYERVRINNDKGFTLEVIDEEAEIVRLIYEWYTVGEKQPDGSYKRLGTSLIAKRLNGMKVVSRKGTEWSASSIRDILLNPVYSGKVRWKFRPYVKKIVDGHIKMSRPHTDESIICAGLHKPIISEAVFNQAQELIHRNPPVPVQSCNTVKNPLSGIVVCGKCGRHMVRQPYTKRNSHDALMCSTLSCNNVSSHLYLVEERILKSLEQWLHSYKLKWNISSSSSANTTANIELKKKTLCRLNAELTTLHKQLGRTYDLLEQGLYDNDTFLTRSRELSERINGTKRDISVLEKDLQIEIKREESAVNIVPKVEKLLETYHTLSSAKAKNDMLKEVLERAVYTKEHSTRWHGSPDDFDITIYPKIPTTKL